MPTEEPQDDKCAARVREASDGSGYCALVKGYGTDHLGEGRCKYHGGCNTGAPEGNDYAKGNTNVNAETHGLNTKRSNYYDFRAPEERAWIDALIDSMMEDAPFDRENFQKFQLVREIAIDMHKKRQANDYIEENGLVEENVVRDEEGNPIMRDGELLTKSEENPVNLAYDRLDRTLMKKMKELGLLDDPDSKHAEAKQDIASELAKMREDEK